VPVEWPIAINAPDFLVASIHDQADKIVHFIGRIHSLDFFSHAFNSGDSLPVFASVVALLLLTLTTGIALLYIGRSFSSSDIAVGMSAISTLKFAELYHRYSTNSIIR